MMHEKAVAKAVAVGSSLHSLRQQFEALIYTMEILINQKQFAYWNMQT